MKKKEERVFNLPLERNGGVTVAGNGEKCAVETRHSNGHRGICRVVAPWWFVVFEREREKEREREREREREEREWRLQAR